MPQFNQSYFNQAYYNEIQMANRTPKQMLLTQKRVRLYDTQANLGSNAVFSTPLAKSVDGGTVAAADWIDVSMFTTVQLEFAADVVGASLDIFTSPDPSDAAWTETEYQAGVLMTPNEDYVRVVNDLNKVTRDLERTHRDLNEAESAHALAAAAYEQNPTDAHREAHEREDRHLKKARRRVETLQATQQHLQQDVITLPREIALPDMREHHYSVFTKTATAQVICFLKMVDTETSEILFTDEFKGSASESDTYIPADSTHNVVGDPLDLPHDAVMVERALADLQEGLNRSLELALRRHGHRFVLLMRKAAKAGDAVAALEQGMMYLFAYPGGYHNTGMMVRAVQEAVSEQGGLINIQVQLSRHCQIMLHHAALPATLTHEKGRLLIRRFTGGSRFNLSLPCELVAIEGKPVKSLAEVEAVLASYGPGEAVRVTVFSKGRTSRLDVSLVEK